MYVYPRLRGQSATTRSACSVVGRQPTALQCDPGPQLPMLQAVLLQAGFFWFRMLKQQRKQKNLLESIGFFGSREWRFSDDNVRRLSAQLSPRDRLLFPMDVAAVDWEAYMKAAARGTKRFLFREEESPRTSEGSRSSIRSANRSVHCRLCAAHYVSEAISSTYWGTNVIALTYSPRYNPLRSA